MKIISCSRPQSKIVERNIGSPLAPTLPKRVLKSTPKIDEDFMNQPIDLRKIKIEQLKSPPHIEDDSALNVSLSSIVGNRLQISVANNQGTDDLRTLIYKMEKEQRIRNKPKRAYHLPQHLQPPVKERFCPEKAYVNKTLQNVMTDNDFRDVHRRGLTRPFPYDLVNLSHLQVDISGERKRTASRIKPTFVDELQDTKDFFN